MEETLKTIDSILKKLAENPGLIDQFETLFVICLVILGIPVFYFIFASILGNFREWRCRKCYRNNQDVISKNSILLSELNNYLKNQKL